MLHAAARRVQRLPQTAARSYASAVPATTQGTSRTPARLAGKPQPLNAPYPEGAARPHLGIEVKPDHGLYAFFRQRVDKGTGAVSHETIEGNRQDAPVTGRSWTAKELRLKSFQDLHTLWYVLVRERNLLATQKEEMRRLQIDPSTTHISTKTVLCRKSMARIKYVLNERRLAYLGAEKLKKEEAKAPKLDAKRERAAEFKQQRLAEARAKRQQHLVQLLEGKQPKKAVAAEDGDILGLDEMSEVEAPGMSEEEVEKLKKKASTLASAGLFGDLEQAPSDSGNKTF